MASHCCFVVPPYLLQSIAEASCNSEEIREKAKSALALRDKVIQVREERLAYFAAPRGHRGQMAMPRVQGIVPDILLQHIADSEDVDENTRKCARRDLEHLRSVHARVHDLQAGTAEAPQQKMLAATAGKGKAKTPESTYRAVYDAKHGDESDLPGKLMRAEGQADVKDDAVNEAFDNVGHVLDMYRETWSWKSIDNENMQVVSSVHFGTNYENAFWDPQRMQMVFGDGDTFLRNFTGCLDVIGHEMTHAVVEHTSPLDYQGQSGALNEHVADVFGIMVKQKIENEKADEADWLIGEGCLVPGVKGVALRNMKEPGTAYDDPRFGKDPQPAHFSKYKATTQDNGGVHIYSGIPNKAFYLCAKEFGGYSWEKAGQIWWKTMNSGRIPARCNFLQFAEVTEDIAEDLYGEEAAAVVKKAWEEVGVVRKTR